MNALVTRHAIVAAFMKTAPYTEQVTGGTLRLAELDAGPDIYHCAIKGSTQLFDVCVLGLETLCIRLQPLFNVSNTEVDEMIQVVPKVRDPFRVVNLLPALGRIPRVKYD